MPTAEARVQTERPSRYLVQLCRHANQMGQRRLHRARTHGGGDTHTSPVVQHVEWSDTYGIVRLSLGHWTMEATPGTLTLHAEATSEKDLQRIQDLVAGRLETIGSRDHLTVTWERPDALTVRPREGTAPGGVLGHRKHGEDVGALRVAGHRAPPAARRTLARIRSHHRVPWDARGL